MGTYRLPDNTMIDERYRITGLLGEGGFGITYKAVNLRTQETVALKELFWRGHCVRSAESGCEVIVPEEDREVFEKQKDRFMREGRMLGDFHKESGIVHVLDYFEANRTAYLVMEYIEGPTLQQYLQKQQPDLEEMLRKYIPLLESMQKVHDAGIMHRDISPENLMLRPDGSLVLIDFGSARKQETEQSHTYTRLVRENYSAPEQYDRQAQQGPWSDVYGLCATLYYVAAGVAPTSALQRAFVDDLKSPGELGVEIIPNYEKIIMRGLSMDASRRQQTAKELADEILAVLPKNEPVNRKKQFLTSLAAAIVVIALIAGMVGYIRWDDTHKLRNVETEEFLLYAPESMTDEEFRAAQNELETRLETFSGHHMYYMDVTEQTIKITVPLAAFAEQEIEPVIEETFVDVIEGRSFRMEAEVQAIWENPDEILTAGLHQVSSDTWDAYGTESCIAVFRGRFSEHISEGTQNGSWMTTVTEMKTRLDALGIPYVFGSLYGNAYSCVVRIGMDRINGPMLELLDNALPQFELQSVDRRLHTIDISIASEGSQNYLAVQEEESFGGAKRIRSMRETMKENGQSTVYLCTSDNEPIAYCEPADDEQELKFTQLAFEEYPELTEESQYIFDYYQTCIRDTDLSSDYLFSGAVFSVVDADGETIWGADPEEYWGLHSQIDGDLKTRAEEAEALAMKVQIETGFTAWSRRNGMNVCIWVDENQIINGPEEFALTEAYIARTSEAWELFREYGFDQMPYTSIWRIISPHGGSHFTTGFESMFYVMNDQNIRESFYFESDSGQLAGLTWEGEEDSDWWLEAYEDASNTISGATCTIQNP